MTMDVETGELIWAFPMPLDHNVRMAFHELFLAAEGTDREKAAIGDPAQLPRPWDPATICDDPELLQATWEWLGRVVSWFNHEYVWDHTAGFIPPCWAQHPHLVHEIAVLADQRRLAGIALTSDLLEDWHRYSVPGFIERMKTRLRSSCLEGSHQAWPARGRYVRHLELRLKPESRR